MKGNLEWSDNTKTKVVFTENENGRYANPECKNMALVVIEDIQEDGSAEWILSFTNSNPEAKDCFKMIDSQTAFRLKEYLTVNAPISLNPPISSPIDKL